MKVRVKVQNHWSSDIRDSLNQNPIREVYIEEHEHDSDPKYGWYLVHTGVETTGTFISDGDVRVGKIIRTYRSSDLPERYERGPWMWISKNEAEPFIEKNTEAKSLLKKYEWNVK
jgi:hypothetical protein